MVQNSVAGLDDYVTGKNTDFSKVGVKAVDDHTLQYTLAQPESFWNSKLTTSTMMPVNEKFLKSAGKDFGSVKPSGILYNGPYYLKSFTSKSLMEFTKNENYYDKDNVKIDDIKLTYFDGSDQDYLARNFSDGNLTTARLFPTSSTFSTIEKKFKDNIVYSPQDATVYYVYFNVNRQNYGHTEKTTDDQKNQTKTALQNKNFRQAINFALDRTSLSAQSNGKDGASKTLRTLLVPPTFVQVDNKDFGSVVEEKLAATGDDWKDVSLADAQDSMFNADKAKAQFAKAKEALQAEGVQFPIHLDVPVNQSNKIFVNQVQSLKQSIESALGKDNVVLDLHQLSTDDFYNITYSASNAAAEDWDLSVGVAWEPDYLDPSTYLDVLKTTNSENTKSFMGYDDPNSQAVEKVGLKEYDQLVDDASKETTDLTARYEKYAKAQAWLTDSALYIPTTTYNGAAAVVSRIKPFSGAYAQAGDKGSTYYFKYLKSQDDIVTKKQYDSAYKDWLKERAKSNDKAQKDLVKHVK